MRLFDCFTFFNELDLLDLRLSELDAVVERFVIAESPLTFTGQEKPLFFHANRDRFARFAHKIEHLVIEDMPVGEGKTAWDREWHQRRALARGYRDAAPDDLVVISDLDEIPRPEVLARLKADPASARCLTILESDASYFYLNVMPVPRSLSLVQAPRVVAACNAGDPQALRAFRARTSRSALAAPIQPLLARLRAWANFGAPLEVRVEPRACWHFTYLGGIEAVRAKISAYSHTEVATDAILDAGAIARSIAERRFFLGDIKLEDVALDESFPRALHEAPEKWMHLVAPTSSSFPS